MQNVSVEQKNETLKCLVSKIHNWSLSVDLNFGCAFVHDALEFVCPLCKISNYVQNAVQLYWWKVLAIFTL